MAAMMPYNILLEYDKAKNERLPLKVSVAVSWSKDSTSGISIVNGALCAAVTSDRNNSDRKIRTETMKRGIECDIVECV
jgi:hypothetical protein